MLKKPEACKGCPFYGDGWGFVPDKLNDQAEVFIYAQNPGENEERGERVIAVHGSQNETESTTPQPLIGRTGLEMERTYFPQAGLERAGVSLGNALRCRYKHEDKLPLIKSVIVREAMSHCHKAHFKLPAKARVIVTQGEYALHALTQEGVDKYNKLSDWRGYILPFEPILGPRLSKTDIFTPGPRDIVVLPTYHIAYTFLDPVAKLVTRWDWRKVSQLLKNTWPVKLPEIKNGPPQVWPKRSAFDTEYNPFNRWFICYSVFDGRILRVSDTLDPVIVTHRPLVIGQNIAVDLPFLEQLIGTNYDFEDEMYAHSVLWSDFPHDLGFLGSLYVSLNRWKHLSVVNPHVYSAGDAFGQWEVWQKLEKELERDPASQKIYEIQKKLIPIIMKAEQQGIRVNQQRGKEAYLERQARCQDLTMKAQAIAGWHINVRSDEQVAQHLYEVEGLLKLIKVKK